MLRVPHSIQPQISQHIKKYPIWNSIQGEPSNIQNKQKIGIDSVVDFYFTFFFTTQIQKQINNNGWIGRYL